MANQTYADMAVEVQDWLHERVKPSVVLAAINDGVESLWMELMQVTLGKFLGGPTQLSIAAASERVQIISVVDPVAAPVVNSVAGGALPIRDAIVVYTLVTASGTETLKSPETDMLGIAANHLLSVTPPVHLQNNGAVAWNVYIGVNSANLLKQNAVPLSFQYPWVEPATGYSADPNLPLPPQLNTTADNIAYIQQIETRLSNGTLKSFSQADISSSFMRNMAKGIAVPSEYQNYAFDLINGDTLEIRPKTAVAISPEFFFVCRPRRAIITTANLPFQGVVHWAYIRYNAMGKISLGNREFFASQGWGQEAERELQKIKLSVGMENTVKNTTVRPYRPS